MTGGRSPRLANRRRVQGRDRREVREDTQSDLCRTVRRRFAPELLAELLRRLQGEENLQLSGPAAANYIIVGGKERVAGLGKGRGEYCLAVRTAMGAGCMFGGFPKLTT